MFLEVGRSILNRAVSIHCLGPELYGSRDSLCSTKEASMQESMFYAFLSLTVNMMLFLPWHLHNNATRNFKSIISPKVGYDILRKQQK